MLRFGKITEKDLELILSWRIKESVTRYMFSDIENDLNKQKEWYQRISFDSSCQYWMIYYEEQPIGVIGLTAIDKRNNHGFLAYYLGEEKSRGIGGIIPPYFYNYVFARLNLKKIIAEVMEGNENVMKLHLLNGYRQVGVLKEHIYKYERFHDVFLFELLDSEWAEKGRRYQKCLANFAE